MLASGTGRSVAKSSGNWICASCRESSVTSPFFSWFQPRTRTQQKASGASKRTLNGAPTTRRHASSTSDRQGGKLPELPARTRFAPSPTGYMHIGGLRTALFSFLLAKKTDGQFLLRIEDTDQKRLVTDAEQRLCDDLRWAGLQWDEGPDVGGPYGPYKQSERNEIYSKHADDLLDSGSAYRCFCTPQTTGAGSPKAAYVTSGCYQDCSSLSSEEAQDRASVKKELFTIRLRQPHDAHKRVCADLIYGKIKRLKRSPSTIQSSEAESSGIDAADTILVKSDGTPTYHFANVVDDHLMKVTHVIRGTEWMASTPLHYDLYMAFGWSPPAFAHVGLLVNENNAKLSKRTDTGLVLDVKGMREQNGVLPEVLMNFLALLGWSNPGRDDVLEMQDLIRNFDLKFTKGNTIVRMEKLWYLQKQHVARRIERSRINATIEPIQELLSQTRQKVQQKYGAELSKQPSIDRYKSLDAYITDVLLVDSKSYQTPSQFLERNRYFFVYDPTEEPDLPMSFDDRHGITAHSLSEMVESLMHSEFGPTTHHSSVSQPESLDSHIDRAAHQIHAAVEECLLSQVSSGEPTLPEVEDDSKSAYKAWKKALMRYLREKLSYGLPGPGVGHIMAILGYDECCRRLNIQRKDGGGWS